MMRLPRRLRRGVATGLVSAALLLALGQARPALAATIVVDGTTCALSDAIVAANSDAPVNGCVAGSGADTIELQTDVTLTVALPAFVSDFVLNGNGHTIDGNGVVSHVLEIDSGQFTLNDAVITGGNAALSFGGGVYNYGGSVTINRSTITENSASYAGGGIANIYGEVTVNNSTISGNSADDGGGIGNFGTVTLNNSTITGNAAVNGGGLHTAGVSTVTLNRSIISGNTGSLSGDEVYSHPFEVSMTANNFNVFGFGGDAGGHNFTPGASDVVPAGNVDSVLVDTLMDNGGLTPTHALVAGSAAIDRAPDDACTAAPVGGTDQRGFTRNVDGNGSASTAECDSGAFEFGGGPTAVGLGAMEVQSGDRGGVLAAAGAGALAVGSAGYGFYRRFLGRLSRDGVTGGGG